MTKSVPRIFRDPIIAYAIVRYGSETESSLDTIPLSVSWDGTEIHGDFDAILAVYPAQPGTYSVHGYMDEIPEEEIWLGYELPGGDVPDWEDVLSKTTYKRDKYVDDDGEEHSTILIEKPSRVDLRMMAVKPKNNRGRPKKQLDY